MVKNIVCTGVLIAGLWGIGACSSLQTANDKRQPAAPSIASQEPAVSTTSITNIYSNPLPLYLSELSNLNDYQIFANGGWDGNWYVGSNVCWIEELPQAPQGDYIRAYVGAKLGRMKTQTVKGRPIWEKEPIPGSVYIAVASTPSWKSNQNLLLTDTRDIPLESDLENALEGVGESRWFWAEVPLTQINFDGPNYVALWSPNDYFTSIASSPVLAGGWGGQKVNSWLNNDVRGYPPMNAATALKTPLTVFEPAIALKLVRRGSDQIIGVNITEVRDGREKTANKTFIVSITGNEIEKAWLEISQDNRTWRRTGRCIYSAPYFFTLKPDVLPTGNIAVRCAAQDVQGNIGYSTPASVAIDRP
jgi:hypothetical protein